MVVAQLHQPSGQRVWTHGIKAALHRGVCHVRPQWFPHYDSCPLSPHCASCLLSLSYISYPL